MMPKIFVIAFAVLALAGGSPAFAEHGGGHGGGEGHGGGFRGGGGFHGRDRGFHGGHDFHFYRGYHGYGGACGPMPGYAYGLPFVNSCAYPPPYIYAP